MLEVDHARANRNTDVAESEWGSRRCLDVALLEGSRTGGRAYGLSESAQES